VGKDTIRIQTDDDELAMERLRELYDLEPTISEGHVTFGIASGEAFVPRLFAELGVPIKSVNVNRPTLDDVFMKYTGSSIRDAEQTGHTDTNRVVMQVMTGRR